MEKVNIVKYYKQQADQDWKLNTNLVAERRGRWAYNIHGSLC